MSSEHAPYSEIVANLVPRASFPLTSGRKTRAMGASISGMRHRYHTCRLRTAHACAVKPDIQNSVISIVIWKWMLPELSFSDRWSRGTKLWERDWIVAGNLLCSPSTLCRHIGLLFGERLDTLFTSSDKKISGFTRQHVIGFAADLFFTTLAPSTRYRIRCGYIFSSLESGFVFFRIRCRIRRIRVDGSRIWKEKVAGSKISGYVWTGP